jgi:surfactin synthase thioesterase subunit
LFCFPYAGGSAAIFRPWAEGLRTDVWAVEYPGRGLRRSEPPARRLRALVDVIVPAITPYLDRPFALFGHSMGALVSFELLRRLKAANAPEPISFLISGCRAPRIAGERKHIHDLPEPEFIEELRSLGGTPDEVLADRELLQLLLPTLRADFEASETYSRGEGPKIPCPTFVYGGMQDPEVTREDLEAWRDECSSTFRLRLFPGNHFFIHSAQVTLLRVLSRDLLSKLDKAAPPLMTRAIL